MHRRDLLRFSVAASTFLAGASLVGCSAQTAAPGFQALRHDDLPLLRALIPVVLSGTLATDTLVQLDPGQSTRLAGYEWRMEGMSDVTGPNYRARRATVTVLHDGKVVTVLTPERRTFIVDNQTTAEAAIHTNAMRDLYAVLGEERGAAAVLRLHHNPFAPWIWFGGLALAFGGMLSLSDRRMRVAAPAPKGATAPA